ncbi:MAG: M48 family metalloprotease [Cyanophyceae cyanobacterium]
MTDAELTQLLQSALKTDQLVLQVKRKDPNIMIMINRDPELGPVDHEALASWFQTSLQSLQDPGLTTLMLYSRLKGQQDPDWQNRISLVSEIVAERPESPPAEPTPVEPTPFEASSSPASPPPSSHDEAFDLSSYSFTRNDLLIRTSLPEPPTAIGALIRAFDGLATADQAFLLPRLDTFLKDPATGHIELTGGDPAVGRWLQQIRELDDTELRTFTIWLSRYCYDPSKTMREVGGAKPGQPEMEADSDDKSQSKRSNLAPRSANQPLPKAGRAAQAGIPLKIASLAGNLGLASGVTLSLLGGMVLVLFLAILGSASEGGLGLGWLLFAIGLTVAFNALMFMISPWIMDLTQRWLYGTRWIDLAQVGRRSPETADMIRRVCAKHRLKEPKLGIIDDQNPTAFTYGNFPNSARVVVSEGLFTYLDDDELAAVYAHELGHVVHWDFAVMTLASTLVQITYLIYVSIRDRVRGNSKAARNIRSLATVAYVFYLVGTYLLLYLSRVREYFADHFAAEVTGNPNALSRALVKIAFGIVEVGERQQTEDQSNRSRRLMEGTRALGIYDARSATSSGTAYRVAARPDQVGKVFLWDMFNPWGTWMELNSTHPLTGKRIRALSTYAEQLGIPAEFDMARVISKGKELDKRRLYGGFGLDIALMNAPWLGAILGFLLTIPAWGIESHQAISIPLGAIILGASLGQMIQMTVMFPRLTSVTEITVLRAMSNPYASPLRGIPMLIQGKLIGRGNAGYTFGSDFKMQDSTGMIFLRYASRFGPIGNFLFGANKVSALIGRSGSAKGWFRRGIAPWIDLAEINTNQGDRVTSHPSFWTGVIVVIGVVAGILLMLL